MEWEAIEEMSIFELEHCYNLLKDVKQKEKDKMEEAKKKSNQSS